MFNKPISSKAEQFTESVIREMTRLALEHDAINLSQGFPDFAAPEVLKKAASDAIYADVNQYAITWARRTSATRWWRRRNTSWISMSIRSVKSRWHAGRPK